MNRKTFLTTISALFSAPFVVKSKDPERTVHLDLSRYSESYTQPPYPIEYILGPDEVVYVDHVEVNPKEIERLFRKCYDTPIPAEYYLQPLRENKKNIL